MVTIAFMVKISQVAIAALVVIRAPVVIAAVAIPSMAQAHHTQTASPINSAVTSPLAVIPVASVVTELLHIIVQKALEMVGWM